MKITKSQLKQIIKEEMEKLLREQKPEFYIELEGKKLGINPTAVNLSVQEIKSKVMNWFRKNDPEEYNISKHSPLHIAMDLNEKLFKGKKVLFGAAL